MGGRRKALRPLVAAVVGCALLGLAGLAVPATGASATGWLPTLPVAQQTTQMLSAFGDGTAYVLDRNPNLITLWHSADHGRSWDALHHLPPGIDSFLSVRFATPKVGYAVDGDILMTTTDGAATADSWRPLRQPSLPKGHSVFADTLGVTGRTVAIAGSHLGPLHLGCNTAVSENIWTSHDGGRHWRDAVMPKNTDVRSVEYLTDHLGIAVVYDLRDDPDDTLGPCTLLGDRTSLFVTRDGGRSFHRVIRCGTVDTGLCWSAKFLTASNVIAGRNDGRTLISRDGGRTFRPGQPLQAAIGSTHTENDEAFWVQGFDFSGQVAYATTKFGGAFRTTDLGRTWTREPSCDSGFSLGIGEVAAFDSQRAIAGGPTCIATRLGGVTGSAIAAVPRQATSGLDASSQSGRFAQLIRGGAEWIVR